MEQELSFELCSKENGCSDWKLWLEKVVHLNMKFGYLVKFSMFSRLPFLQVTSFILIFIDQIHQLSIYS
jgi:hypothetical protein